MLKHSTAEELADLLEGMAHHPHNTGGLSMLDEATAAFGELWTPMAEAHQVFGSARYRHMRSYSRDAGGYSDDAWEQAMNAARALARLLRPLGGFRIARCERQAPWGTCELPLDGEGACRSSLGHTGTEEEKRMGWIQHGEIWADDGQHTDEQVGKAASVRFVNPELPGCRVTVYAYPSAPEKAVVTKDGTIETFHGFTHDMDGFKIETQVWFEIDEDAPGDADEWNPTFSGIQYAAIETGSYSGTAEEMIAAAEEDALAWVRAYRPARIKWDGKRF
jgi:hypothetical protein